jgi:hypothetical protein
LEYETSPNLKLTLKAIAAPAPATAKTRSRCCSQRSHAGGKAGDHAPERGTEMAIASASKWIYGAFSSPGAFGFYPWISADRRFYGMVAREQRHGFMSGDPSDKLAVASVDCGREIRAAWMDGRARP